MAFNSKDKWLCLWIVLGVCCFFLVYASGIYKRFLSDEQAWRWAQAEESYVVFEEARRKFELTQGGLIWPYATWITQTYRSRALWDGNKRVYLAGGFVFSLVYERGYWRCIKVVAKEGV